MVRIRPIREAGCAELSDHSLSGYSLRANLIEEMPLIRPGHAVFAIRKCLVRMRRSSSQRRIPVFNVETPVTAGDVVSGRLTVLLKSYAFARIKLSEMLQVPDREHLLFGVSTEGATVEANVSESRLLDLLLPAGDHLAYVGGATPIYAPFSVRSGEEDIGTIELG